MCTLSTMVMGRRLAGVADSLCETAVSLLRVRARERRRQQQLNQHSEAQKDRSRVIELSAGWI